MNLREIKTVIAAGRPVYWKTQEYKVIRDNLGQYLIVYTRSNNAIGLTHRDGVTLNGAESDFFVCDDQLTAVEAKALEAFIDRVGLKTVAAALAVICESKAQHIAYNWIGSDATPTQVRAWQKASVASSRYEHNIAALPF